MKEIFTSSKEKQYQIYKAYLHIKEETDSFSNHIQHYYLALIDKTVYNLHLTSLDFYQAVKVSPSKCS